MSSDVSAVTQSHTRAGKYLTFFLADEEYGIEIMRVREIFGMLPITIVPQTPEFVKGVINLRGKVIPVIDLRLKFRMERRDYDKETCIIVVEVDEVHMGIVVDTVQEVLDIANEDIEDSPHFGTSVDTEFILGMGNKDNRVTILLDVGKVISSEDLVLASALGGDEQIKIWDSSIA